ncbi:phosphate ABC transporter permease PstA [Cohnella sp.]|uniref:phosphate ABC transporter permease PstA n=1 Tax=Cohnella sp. TaxID=1883426 RepID=UPI003568B608
MKDLIQEDRGRVLMRRRIDFALNLLFLAATSVGVLVLVVLIVDIVMDGLNNLTPELFNNYPSRKAAQAGMKSAIVGTIYMLLIMAPISFVFGVGAAIYLEEYASKNRFTRFIQLNISTLAGVPSIVYGILGLTLFVRLMALERSLIAGALTMTLLVLPIIIVASQEAIKAVPRSRRDASFALGANKWQTVSRAVMPSALPGILTGVILAMSRAIGETAPLVMIGALTYIAFLPDSLKSSFTVMPIQIFNWISRPQEEFHMLAAAGIIVLLAMLLLMNFSAILLRNKFQNKL